jgi:hypothetical protein
MRRVRALGFVGMMVALTGCPDRTMYLAAQCSDPVGVGDDPAQLPRGCPVEDAGTDVDAATDAADDGPDAEEDGG